MKVAWIVVSARGSKQEVEPYIPGVPFTRKPDYKYYARRVAETLARITEVFNVDEENLLTGSRQISLGSFQEEKKKKTLFDFE